MLKMPISEIIDRYTISLLKTERTTEDVKEELDIYKKEIKTYPKNKKVRKEIRDFIKRLYEANGRLWNEEKIIKMGEEKNYPLKEIGKRALNVRDLNRIRNGIKAEIVDVFAEGFKEIKTNYTKVDYGGTR